MWGIEFKYYCLSLCVLFVFYREIKLMGNTLFILGLQGYLGLNTNRVLVDISERKKKNFGKKMIINLYQ